MITRKAWRHGLEFYGAADLLGMGPARGTEIVETASAAVPLSIPGNNTAGLSLLD